MLGKTQEQGDTDSETDELIELQTLPYPGRRKRIDTSKAPKMATKKGKGGLGRIFGTRKTSGGNKSQQPGSKFDVVRGVEGIHYTKKDYETVKEIKKNPYVPVRSSIVNGHKFEHHNKPTWCDMCEDFIWGLYTQAVRCQYCRYTCHAKCVSVVDLDCPKAPSTAQSREELTNQTLEILSDVTDVTDGAATISRKNNNLPNYVSSISELRRLIKEYNENSSLIMTLHDDYTFDGFIRVHMNLSRPVNVSSDLSNLTMKKAVARNKAANRRPISDVFDVDTSSHKTMSSDDSGIGSQSSTASSTMFTTESATLMPTGSRKGRRPSRRLSFYMPKGTYKPLHVTSKTTAREVIEALLSKYNVTDNPTKFALYEKTSNKKSGSKESEVVYRRIVDEEKPLALCLSWGGITKDGGPTFALKENEDGKVQWDYFEIPELKNFMNILQLEEDQLLAQIMQKYENYREALQRTMDEKKVHDITYTAT